MSGNDKTGERLVASIRKTKAGAQTADSGPGAAAGPRPRAARPKARAKGSAGQTAAGSGYQHGRRVWPD